MISIIIPFFNATKYLHQLYECLQNQSNNNFEVILIDDGSTDNSAELYRKLFENSSFESVLIRQDNSGPGKARKTGLENANGDFISFLDVDDLLTNDTVEFWYQELSKDDFDILICNSETVNKKGQIIGFSAFSQNHEKPYIDFLYQNFPYTLWPNLFRKSVISKVKFYEDIRNGEDFLTMTHFFLLENLKVKVSNKVIHRYIRTLGSITDSISEEKFWFNYYANKTGLKIIENKLDINDRENKSALIFNRLKFIYSSIKINSPYSTDSIAEIKKKYSNSDIKKVIYKLSLIERCILIIALQNNYGLIVLMKIFNIYRILK